MVDMTAKSAVYLLQTHHMQCPNEPQQFAGVDCRIFDNNKPKTMALSVLVVIEMLNALNRFARQSECLLIRSLYSF